MTRKTYETDSEIFNVTASVVMIGKKEIRLLDEKNQPYQKTCGFIETDHTIFHPQGGGQPADRGFIGDAEILHVSLEKTAESQHILHYYDFEKFTNIEKYQPGDRVELRIDPEFRFQCARYHSAGHLLADIVEKAFPVVAVKGNHFPNQASVTFVFSDADDSFFNSLKQDAKIRENTIKDLQEKFDVKVKQAIPVSISESDQIRKISISDRVMPCGGTHVENTARLFGTSIFEITPEKKPPGFKIKYSCA